MTDLNETKKWLYKTNARAFLQYIRKGNAIYYTPLLPSSEVIIFEIPISDMGDTDFTPTMEAKLLIRWILTK